MNYDVNLFLNLSLAGPPRTSLCGVELSGSSLHTAALFEQHLKRDKVAFHQRKTGHSGQSSSVRIETEEGSSSDKATLEPNLFFYTYK